MKRALIVALMMTAGVARANVECIVTMASGQQYVRSQPNCVTTQYAGSAGMLSRAVTVLAVAGAIIWIAEKVKENREAEQAQKQTLESKKIEEVRRRTSVLDEKLWKDAESRLSTKLSNKEDQLTLIECPHWRRLFATTDQATINYWTPKYNETCSNLPIKDYGNPFIVTVESFVDLNFKESHEVVANTPSEAIAAVKAKYEFGVIAYLDLAAMANK